MKRILAVLALSLAFTTPAQAQEIAPCIAITGTDSLPAERCIAVPIPPPPTGFSVAYGLWTPGEFDTCSKAQHDSYKVTGPDGKIYPTWHPPVDPSGCTFGHEHGRDPRGSDLYAEIGSPPFGLANEALQDFEGRMHRHEDHVGHKIEWVNNAKFAGKDGHETICDALVKIHQGSHSADAFTNNVHEVAYHLDCADGTKIHFTSMVPIGKAGSMFSGGGTIEYFPGAATPADSPGGVGMRMIPTRPAINAGIAGQRSWVNYGHVLTETWAIDPVASSVEGGRIAYIATYSFVSFPARYYDPATNALRRTLDICYEVEDPKDGRNMGECKTARTRGVTRWDAPGSPFIGAKRQFAWNQPILTNAGKPEVLYTDPFGKGGRTTPFPGSIKQFFAAINNNLSTGGPRVNADYTAPGVRAPN